MTRHEVVLPDDGDIPTSCRSVLRSLNSSTFQDFHWEHKAGADLWISC